MNLGDKLLLEPTFYSRAGLDRAGLQEATVVYIHPKGRFYTVRFYNRIGGSWTESFSFAGGKKERTSQ